MAVHHTADVAAGIVSFVKETGSLVTGEFDATEKWIETGLLTSLQLVQLVMFVQKAFSITVSHHDVVASNFESLQATVDFVTTRAAG